MQSYPRCHRCPMQLSFYQHVLSTSTFTRCSREHRAAIGYGSRALETPKRAIGPTATCPHGQLKSASVHTSPIRDNKTQRQSGK
ncbi:hypothetical protein AVEN_95771-1 [Araneus ventricosus]|uniref:Uncharacterized protein n=1 Tax=Araneus ventricosus TaxID=182803 RepID=A0A4Y2GK18_ARAVE|nr:hypothetical protein AVEN_95771-1 [Araneus ventricosus]